MNKALGVLDIYINILEVLTMRKNLLDAVYETSQVLILAYKSQCRSYQHDINKLLVQPIRLDEQTVQVQGSSINHFISYVK